MLKAKRGTEDLLVGFGSTGAAGHQSQFYDAKAIDVFARGGVVLDMGAHVAITPEGVPDIAPDSDLWDKLAEIALGVVRLFLRIV